MALLFELKQKLAQGFQAFYSRYPRKEARKDAVKAWGQVVNDDPEIEAQIHTALDWQIPHWNSLEWYTPPLPASYLRGERFTDQPMKPKTPTPNRTIGRPETDAQTQQRDVHTKIQMLIDRGMSPEDAKRTVYTQIGWIKE